jgi:hypothetical protein
MAVQLANERMLQAESLASQCEAAGGEVDQLSTPGLSGEAGWGIAGLDDQFGKGGTFILAGAPQNGLLLSKSILGMHKGPVNGLRELLSVEPVTPDGAAEEADLGGY